MHCISFICIQNTYEIHCIFEPILKDIHEYFFLRKNFRVKNLDFDPKMDFEKHLKNRFWPIWNPKLSVKLEEKTLSN